MELAETFQRLGTALGLGLLVGLQRERSGAHLAGFRTFPLITLFGSLVAMLAAEFGGWTLGLGMLSVAMVIVVGNLQHGEGEASNEKPGLTTEAAMLVMFALGAFTAQGNLGIAAVLGGTVAVLLHMKATMQSVARRLADPDLTAIMQFVLITLVILPLLPNRAYGPYQVLNPFKIWLMVVLIVGISLGGYIIYKFFGQRVGTMAGGVLGGIISSTATTVSFARQSARAPQSSALAALVIMVASSIVFIRVLALIGATSPELFGKSFTPIGVLLGGMAAVTLLVWHTSRQEKAEFPPPKNPTQLKTALIFAALYALVLLGAAAAKDHFGPRGLYAVAIISGLTDMDAITLSISQMVSKGQVSAGNGWRLIMVAALANLVFKAGMVAALGARALLLRILALFGISFVMGLAVILFWPK